MRHSVVCCTLLFGGMALAQQGQRPPTGQPPYQTPPTFPEGRQPPQPMPPDTHAPPPHAMSSEQVEVAITDELRADPALSGTNIDAKVDDSSVILTGDVDSMRQHDAAVRIAESNAGNRRVVDRIQLKQRTRSSS